MSLIQFYKLHFLSKIRSVSLTRDLAATLTLLFFALMIFGYFVVLAFSLDAIITHWLGVEDTVGFVNSFLFFLFATEFFYRFFLQKLPVLELQHYLHLPIKRNKIIHFLLQRSFLSLLNLFVILLLLPFTLQEVGGIYGGFSAFSWLAAIVFTSWTLHWLLLIFKKQMGDHLMGLVALFLMYLGSFGAQYLGWYNAGTLVQPFFDAALGSVFPALAMLTACAGSYFLAHRYFRNRAYAEEIAEGRETDPQLFGADYFARFGKAGAFADLEWRLIIRHKKSRSYLFLSMLFLLYGLFFYPQFDIENSSFDLHVTLFVGLFITGIFLIQYGQLYLSWNSANFDYYLTRHEGLQSLIEGKNLLFVVISAICFLLSVPYVYFGWQILVIHFVALLFNMGVNLPMITLMALWKPKPMDINKGAMFNYEGVGAAQFLMIIPIMGLPYLIYLPFALTIGYQAGLMVLAALGITGIIYHKKITRFLVKKIIQNRYQISASFRQEL